jgi:hypothetical protein
MICVQLVLVWLATFDVDVQGPAWQVEALRATLVADLTSDQLQPAPKGEIHVEITVGDPLRYELSRAGVAPVRGVVPLPVDRQNLAGVLKDHLHRLVPHASVAAEPPVDPPPLGALGILAALAALLAVPLVLAPRTRTFWPRAVVAWAVIGAVAFLIVEDGDLFDQASAGIFFAGGIAWGAAIAVCIPILWPPLHGLHRVEHGELAPALRSWIALAIQRTLRLAVILAPLGVVLWLVGDPVTSAIIAPLAILVLRLAWRGLVAALAARLDERFVETPHAANPYGGDAWHEHVRAYFVGYLRRANLEVDEDVLARMRFSSGNDPERVAIYGGGLTHTRIVIGRAMLERALAPYGRPHDYAMPRVSTLHWTHWNAGLVMPTASDEHLATREDRDPGTSAHTSAEATEHERIALGEVPTLTGVIEPTAFDPRTSYRPEEDPLWLDWDPGEEHDGTDAGDKDFLFGLLVEALGIAQRHEDRTATLFLWLPRLRIPALFTRQTSGVADMHAMFNGARHHLAQYLAWQLFQREDLMTARAYVPQLEATSRKILAALDADTHEHLPTVRDRLRHLRRFLDPRAVIVRSRRQRLAVAFALLAAFAAVTALAVQAVLYHSTYEERHQRDGKRPQ